jgi:hypothetical protein
MSPSRTVNPAPRRALRKADDAGVHPATTRPAPLSPVVGVGELTPVASPVVPDAAAEGGATADAAKAEKSKNGKASAGKPRGLESAADKKPGSAKPAAAKPAAATRASGDAPTPAAKKASGAARSTGAAWDNRFHGNTSDVLRAQHTTNDLLRGAEGILEVKVPKRLRKAVRLEAESRGLTIDKVVTRLLADWIESP